LTSTVPTPGTFLVLTVTAEEDEVPALLALPAELAVPEAGLDPEPDVGVADDAPHAATVMAAPETRLTPSSRRADEPL
jgi:hypothetical protein